MSLDINIRMPEASRRNPLTQLGKRVVVGVVLLALITLGTYAERDGYIDPVDGKLSFLDALYYASVTMTTTGYGDIVPKTDTARLFTSLVVTPARVVFLILLVGTSVELIATASRTVIQENRWRRRVKNHIVICGFGVKGRTALASLRTQGAKAEDIVVIDPSEEALNEAASLGCVGIMGDASRNELLRAARVDRARVVIVAPNRDDAGVLITLSVRDINPKVRVVAAVRELENARLMRRSGADVVLASSGSTGRMLGLAATTPHYVQVIEELLETGSGFDLVERNVEADDAKRLQEHSQPGELIIAVFRDDQLVARNPDGGFILHPGDQIVSVAAPLAQKTL